MWNKLIKYNSEIFRILNSKEDYVFAINCTKQTMPKWIRLEEVKDFTECTEKELLDITSVTLPDIETLDIPGQKQMNERFNIIAEILPFEIGRASCRERV